MVPRLKPRRIIAVVMTALMLFDSTPATTLAYANTYSSLNATLNKALVQSADASSGVNISYASDEELASVLSVDEDGSDGASEVSGDVAASGEGASSETSGDGTGAGSDAVNYASAESDSSQSSDSDAGSADGGQQNDDTESAGYGTSESDEDGEAEASLQSITDAEDEDLKSLGGRDYAGQVTKTINGMTYILIGNEQQLRAIGSGKQVIDGSVWKVEQTVKNVGTTLKVDLEWVDTGTPELVYAGDADLGETDQLRDAKVDDHDGGLSLVVGSTRTKYFTYNADGTRNDDISSVNTGLKYTTSANYLIFRNIDLSTNAADSATTTWTPLMFYGTMLGAVSASGDTAASLWDCINADSVSTTSSALRPVISNVAINQTGTIDASTQQGVGFFASLTSSSGMSDATDGSTLGSSGSVTVANIKLKGVFVKNDSAVAEVPATVLGALTKGPGTLLDAVTRILGINLNLEQLLTLHQNNPSNLATGAFAGRVYGSVVVNNCAVEDVSISSVSNMTGGFIGYSEGATNYFLGKMLESVIDLLSGLLNLIPYLGLGDLIDWLLSSTLGLDNLIPTSYTNPVISGCSVTNFAEGTVLGSSDQPYAGGFVGNQIGTVIRDCSVSSEKPFTVAASSYAGGFAGMSRNGNLGGTLNNLGIDLVDTLPSLKPQSLIQGCSVAAGAGSSVAATSYAGGFCGAMANAYAVNDATSGFESIAASTDYAGGFSGAASVGWGLELGSDDTTNLTLLKSLSSSISSLLSGDWLVSSGTAGDLLSLAGIDPSVVLGAQVSVANVSAGGKYAGGVVGSGSGTTIGNSSAANMGNLAFWKYSTAFEYPTERTTLVSGLERVTAGGSYAGGIAGTLQPATVGALLNNVLSIGDVGTNQNLNQFACFVVEKVTLAGAASKGNESVGIQAADGLVVTAGEYYAGGAIGCATGGDVADTTVSELASVTAKGEAGGFIGFSGPGEAVGTSGLSVLGLIKISGLLSVAQYSSVTVTGGKVAGIASGFTVEATGKNENNETNDYAAGGFFGQANSTNARDCHVTNLYSVKADSSTSDGLAGGFVGYSTTGGLADALDSSEGTKVLEGLMEGGLIEVSDLLGAVPYLIPDYKYTTVSFVNGGYVEADVAGGFAGEFQSGRVNQYTSADKKADNATELLTLVTKAENNPWAVINLDHVSGGAYAGGWGGIVESGALASAGNGGLNLLGKLSAVNLTNLLSVAESYVPCVSYAGVHSTGDTLEKASGRKVSDENNPGLVVSATRLDDADSQSGSAGGFAGYASGAQISNCDVTQLRHTTVKEPSDLEATEAPSYFDGSSSYAVSAPRYAGGYVGRMNVGSAASVGDSLSLLGDALTLNNVLDVLDVVVTTVEHSDVTGGTGGFAVLANGTHNNAAIGDAGGFAGIITGGHIQDSNSYNFSYVIGQVSAGGYAGQIEPGDVASVLGSTNDSDDTWALGKLLKGLVSTSGTLASLLQDFVPTIRNSETTCIPCGGAVRAQAESDGTTQRGMAGGYVGHNLGGHIWGNNNASWKSENDENNHYNGTKRVCAAVRIRSVYGAEMAGGFTGFMEPADTAKTGSLSLLFGLVQVNSLLGALQVAYATEENTMVTGPLRGVSVKTWNSWAKHVGAYGYYGGIFANKTFEENEQGEAELAAFLESYIYGTNVVAGRSSYSADTNACDGGVAGGYVGLMRGGTITEGHAYDTKLVSGMRAAGGFAGRMETGGAAELGGVSILGLNLNVGQLVSALQVLVPVVKSSGTQGFRTGLTVRATGTDTTHELGFAGGYVGYASGAQIWGDETFSDADKSDDRWTIGATHEGYTASGCTISNLRRVSGANCVGGFAGYIDAAGVADVNTNASNETGLLQKVLDSVVSTPSSLVSVLECTVSTVRGAHVSAVVADEGGSDEAKAATAWGYVVDGSYAAANGSTAYARAAGGFAGACKAVVLGKSSRSDGEEDSATNTLTVSGLRSVEGGQYAGGFVGQADVTSVASVGGGDTGDQSTSLLLKLVKAGNISALDAFRTYIYYASVAGVDDGFQVKAHDSSTQGILDSKRYTGAAGGFAGAIINGSAKNCTVTALNAVSGVNYAGGFVGHLGKSATVDVDNAEIKNVLGVTAGVLDVWGSYVEDSSVTGISAGYTVTSSHNGADYGAGTDAATGREVAGGFAGYADLARIKGCSATNLKKVTSGEVSGGFVGQTVRAYLVDAEVSSVLLDGLLKVVNALVKLLYLDKAQDLGVINIGGWFPGVGDIFNIEVLGDGNLLYVNLFGLKVSVALSKADEENEQQTDVAIVTIGDSVIKLPCTEDGIDTTEARSNLTVQLIKGNRTRVENCTVSGISSGYDVFGGGASQTSDGADGLTTGYAGGFAGLNDEGVLAHNTMTYCDVVRGTSGLVDPFSNTKLKSNWNFNSMSDILGETDDGYNSYTVYRSASETLTTALTSGGSVIAGCVSDELTGLDSYTVNLFEVVNCYDGDVSNSAAAGDSKTKWVGIKDAVRASADRVSSSASEDLAVYESAAKAVLMLDTEQADNGASITPEPGEGQDPCSDFVNVTLQKVWNDYNDRDKLRAKSVTFTLTAKYTTGSGEDAKTVTPETLTRDSGEEITNPLQVTLSAEDATSGSSDTWRKAVEGLPVGFKDEDGAFHYYTYSVTAETMTYEKDDETVTTSAGERGYVTSTATRTGDLTITVTNTHQPALPNTGGAGTLLLGVIAAMLVSLGGWWMARKSRERRLCLQGSEGMAPACREGRTPSRASRRDGRWLNGAPTPRRPSARR